MPSSSFLYVTGGTLAPDAPSYVERHADRVLLESLLAGETCYVLNSRQMGKSSLCVRTIGKLKEQGIRTAFCDLTKFGGRNVTPEQWYAALTAEIGRDLGLRAEFIAYFKENSALPPVQRLFGAIVEVGLVPDSPLVVFIDEIDATRSLSFSTDEFFAAIRECHNRRVQDSRYLRLSFCMLGVAVPSDLINIATSTPFNIGRRIALEDFTLDEAMALSAGLCSPTRSETAAQAVLKRVHEWTNGQPYLTQSLCSAIAGDETILTAADVDRLVHRDLLDPMARQTNINLADVANRAVHAGDLEPDPEKFRADLLSAYERIWRGKHYADDEANRTAALLKLSGIVAAEGNKLRVRNLIYRRVFERAWVRENMPGQELRRQRRSFWKGVLRTSLVSAAVVCVVGYFAFLANQAQRTAEAAKKELDYQLYVAKMNNLQLFDQEGNGAQMAKILEETKDSPHRGWEWGYWNRKLDDSDEEYVLDSKDRDTQPSASFSADGKQILIVDGSLSAAFLVDRKSKGVIRSYPVAKDEYVQPFASGWLAAADRNGVMEFRDLASGRVHRRIPIGKESQGYVMSSERGSEVLVLHQYSSAGQRSRSSVIDVSSGAIYWDNEVQFSNKKYESAVCTSGDGSRTIVLRSKLSNVSAEYAVVDRSNRAVDQLPADPLANINANISISGRYWAGGTPDKLLVRDLDKHLTLLTIEGGGNGRLDSPSFDRTETLLACRTDKNRVVVWSIPDRRQIAAYENAYSVQFSPSSDEMVIVGSTVRVVRIDRAAQGPQGRASVYGVGRATRNRIVLLGLNWIEFLSDPGLESVAKVDLMGAAVAMSINGRIHAKFETSKAGRESVMRETDSGRVLLRSKLGWSYIDTPDIGDLFAVASQDGSEVEVFQYGSSRALWRMRAGVGDRVFQLSFSPSGQTLLIGSRKKVDVVDATNGSVRNSIPSDNANVGFFHSDDDYWIMPWRMPDRSASVYDGKSHVVRYKLATGEFGSSMAASPDGSRVITTDMTNTTIWDPRKQQRVCRIPGFRGCCFTRDGKTLLGTRNGRFEAISTSETNPVTRLSVVTSTDAARATKSP